MPPPLDAVRIEKIKDALKVELNLSLRVLPREQAVTKVTPGQILQPRHPFKAHGGDIW